MTEIEQVEPIDPEQEILDSLSAPNGWVAANPKKKFPPRRAQITDGPVNKGKTGFVMSRFAGLTQIATGVCSNGTPDCTWYYRKDYELLNKRR